MERMACASQPQRLSSLVTNSLSVLKDKSAEKLCGLRMDKNLYNAYLHSLGQVPHLDTLRKDLRKGNIYLASLGVRKEAQIAELKEQTPRICILGGGFGGLYTALRLDSLTWSPGKRPQILLIDQSDRFVFKPLLYEILSKDVDQWEIAPTFTELLANTNIRFVKDSVKAVAPPSQSRENGSFPSSRDTSGGTVLLESGTRVDYDWLVLALGSESKLDFVPGAAENALPFVSLEDALKVDQRVSELERERSGLEENPIQVVIVDSGYSGVELAATLAERLGKRGKVRVVDAGPDVCAGAAAGSREAAEKVLSSRNVELVLGYIVTNIRSSTEAARSSGDNGSACTSSSSKYLINLKLATSKRRRDNSQLEADLVLWTVGTKATVPSRDLDMDYPAFPVNGRGQADTDEYLRVKGHPRKFAIGDSAGTKDSAGRILPSTAQVAFQQADYAAWNLWAAINERPLLPFRYQHLGEMMTLGKTDGAVSAGFVDLTLDGIVGHSARKLAYLYRPTLLSPTLLEPPSDGSPENVNEFVKRMEQTWLISKQPRPVVCKVCEASGRVDCPWCKGTGFFMIGDKMLCEVPSRNTLCKVCYGEGTLPCDDCKGTGFRAKWLGDPTKRKET